MQATRTAARAAKISAKEPGNKPGNRSAERFDSASEAAPAPGLLSRRGFVKAATLLAGAPLAGCGDAVISDTVISDATSGDAGAAPVSKAAWIDSGWIDADWLPIRGISATQPGNSYRPGDHAGPWTWLRNVIAPAGLVDGVDYSIEQWQGAAERWPGAFGFSWDFPAVQPGDGLFCWAYPALLYGAGPWGYHADSSDNPPATRAGDFRAFAIDVDLGFSGANGANILLDIYTLPAPDRFEGRNINEVSIFLNHDGVGPLTWLQDEAMTRLSLPAGLGDCAVYKQPTSSQVMVMPHQHGRRRSLLRGRVDVKAVFDGLIAAGLVDRNAWVTGFELGVEIQRPNRWNTAPHAGHLRVNSAPAVVWR